MDANFNVRKTYSTIERMDICKSSIKLVLVPPKERITRTNFFLNKYTTAEITTQTIDDCKISR